MTEFRSFKSRTLVVAANGEETVFVTGTYFVALAATGAFKLALDDMPPTDFQAGLGVTLDPGAEFKQVRLIDTSGAINTIEFNTGFGSFADNRLVVPDGLDISVATTLSINTDKIVATGVNAQLIVANGARRELVIQNLSTSGGAIRVGPNNTVAATNGIEVGVGATLKLDYSGEVWVFNTGGADANIAFNEVSD